MPPLPLKRYDLPAIDPEYMTPQVQALMAFVEELLLKREEQYAQAVAVEEELKRLQRAKKRGQGRSK